MTRGLKQSIIVLVSLMAFETLIGAEDRDDLAPARINKLFLRYPRTIAIENRAPNSEDFENKLELESRLSNLLEFDQREPGKTLVVREDKEDIEASTTISSETSLFEYYDPTSEQDEEEDGHDESVDEKTEKTERETRGTPKPAKNHKNKHRELLHRIRDKLTDKNTKLTVSLPVAIIIGGSTIIVTCCCSLYLRNRLVACAKKITGKKKRKSKMIFVDSERGRSIPRSRRKSLSSSKRKRARSLSQDLVNIATRKSSTAMMSQENDEPSATGCYRCCKKKKKRANKK